MAELGARCIAPRGAADAGEGNISGVFDLWQIDHLWPAIAELSTSRTDSITMLDPSYLKESPDDSYRPIANSETRLQARVGFVNDLTAEADRPKFHMEIELPEGTTYDVGDYLEVYPQNTQLLPKEVEQVFRNDGSNGSDSTIATLCSDRELSQPVSSKVWQPETYRH